MKRTIYLITALMVLAAPAGAVDLSSDTSSDSSYSEDVSIGIRNSIDDKLTTTKSASHDVSHASASRTTRSGSRDATNSISVPILALLPSTELKYRLAADLGLAAEMKPGGWIDTTAQDWYSKAWSTNAPVSAVGDINAINKYLDAVSRTGMIAGQAQILLLDRISSLSGRKAAEKSGKKTIDASSLLGIDDLAPLATQAWLDARKNVSSPHLLGLWKRIQTQRQQPCRLANGNDIVCGTLVLSLTSPPKLTISGIEIYGTNTFGGLTSDVKVSATNSLAASFENSKTVTDSRRNAVDKAHSKGDAFEVAQNQRDALNESEGAKTNISAGKFIPVP